MADTANFAWTKPTVGGSSGAWGTILNTLFDDIDSDLTAQLALKAPLAGPTFTGTLTAANITASGTVNVDGRLTVDDVVAATVDLGSVGSALNSSDGYTLASANYFYATVATNTAVAVPAGLPSSGTLASWVLEITTTGSQTVSWNAAYEWPGGSAPSQTASGTDIYVCWTRDAGTTIYALKVAEDVS